MPGPFDPFRWNRSPFDAAGPLAARVMLRGREHLDAGGSSGSFFRAVNRAK
jgi:hypothetical protein